MSALNNLKKQTSATAKDNRKKRREESMKEYGRKEYSASDKAYIEGNYRKVASNQAYGYRQGLKKGEIVKGTESDWLDSSRVRLYGRVNYDKKAQEMKYAKYKPKVKYNVFTSANQDEEGTFKDRLNTFDGNGKIRFDGIETAKNKQRTGKPLQNAGHYLFGGAKDIIVDPVMDFVRGVDRVESAITGGALGLVETGANALDAFTDPKAKFSDYQKGNRFVKDNVKKSLEESDKTGWGRSSSDNFKDMDTRKFENDVEFMRRNGKSEESIAKFVAEQEKFDGTVKEVFYNILGLGVDIANPISVGNEVSKLGKKAFSSFDDMIKGTADLSTGFVPKELTNFKGKQKPPTKATGASDEVFFSGKAIDDVENTKLDRVLNKGYKDAVGKPEPIVKTGNQVVDDFVSTLKQPKETKIDVPKTKEELNVELSSFSGRQKMFNSINPIKLKDETGELNFLMKDILGYKSKLGKNDNKGKGLLNTKIKKLPKGKREEFINALNDNLFDGNPVIHKNASYGYIRELAEKYTKNTPEQFYNDVIPKISSSLTDPSHYDKGRFLKEHGGIGEYQKYVDETNRLIEHSNTLKPGSIEFSNVQKDILERQDKIRKRNKLASEIYSLEPERFYKEYSGDFSNNPLGIKDSEWKHNNQIKDLVDNGVLDDNAKRIDTNVQETFVSSPQESQMENGSYINKQIWDIVAGNVGGGKRVSYHKGSIKDLDTQINTLSKDLEEAFSNFDFDKMGEINKSIEELKIDKKSKQKLIKEMGKEFENLKSLVSDDAISQQSVINDLLGDIYEKFPHLKTNGDKPKVTPKAKQKKIFDNLKPLEGMDKSSVSIARRIAEQHGIKEPVKFKFGNEINPTRYRDNKVEIQKLAELRVLQSTTKGATGKVMDDALSLLIKEHMDNMKTSLPPQEYAKLQNGVKQYVNDMKKAYSVYSSGKNKYMQNPLEKIGDKKFYTSKMDEEGAILDKLAESKALDMKYDDAINSQNITTSIESISGSTPQVIPGDNKSLSANLQLLASNFVDDVKNGSPLTEVKNFNEGIESSIPQIRRKYDVGARGNILDRIKSPLEKSYRFDDELPPISGKLTDDGKIINHNTGETTLSPFATPEQKKAFDYEGYSSKNASEYEMLKKFVDKQANGTSNIYDAMAIMDEMGIKFNPNDETSMGEAMNKLFRFIDKKGVVPTGYEKTNTTVKNVVDRTNPEMLENISKEGNVLERLSNKINPNQAEIDRKRVMDAKIDSDIKNLNRQYTEEMYEGMFDELEFDATAKARKAEYEETQRMYEALMEETDMRDGVEKAPNKKDRTYVDKLDQARKRGYDATSMTDRELDEKIAKRLTPERMDEVLNRGGAKPDPNTSRYDDYTESISKSLNDTARPETLALHDSADAISESHKAMDKMPNKPNNKVSSEVAMDIEELAKEGIDATKQPPKEKPQGMSTNLYKRWLNTWKKGVTAYNPGWHIQNFFQNKGQNYLALGVDAFMPQTDAKKILKAMNGKSTGEMINLGKNGQMNVTELAELADKLGVAEGLSNDVINSKGLFPNLETKIDNSGLNKWLSKSENTARLNHWVKQMQNGMTPDDALKSVNKYLFDYSDKGGKANELIGDYIDPFWTFHRNNARLMFESAINNPSEFAKIQRGLSNLDANIDPSQEQYESSKYRDYQHPGASFVDEVNGGQYNYLYDQNMLPDFKGAIPTTQGEFENKLNPLARIALQHSRKEGNFGNKIVEAGQEAGWGEITPIERGWEVFKDLNPVLPQVLNTLDKTHGRQKKADEGKVSQETTDKQILNDWLQYLTGQKANWYRNI